MNEKVDKISQEVLEVKECIETEELSIKQLQNYYNNASKYSKITDYEKEFLIDVITKKMRIKHPRHANKILGGKSEKAKELLLKIFDLLKKEFDWSKNKVKSKVKAGGHMISGEYDVVWYISYKNVENYSTAFVYWQKTPESDPYLEVSYRRVGKDYENEREAKEFPVGAEEDALNLYRSFLSKTIIKK